MDKPVPPLPPSARRQTSTRSKPAKSTRARARVDLHTHTTASDGQHSPEELIELARERGVTVLALTDHDTTASLDRAAQAARKAGDVDFVPGVELSCDVPGNEVHVLGYFIEWQDPALQEMLVKFRDGRIGRAQQMAAKLAELGAPVSFERVQEIAGDGSIGRPHVAQALLEAGHVQTISEAFEKYLGRNSPAYFERYRLTPEDAIGLILAARGIPVLAHPHRVLDYVPGLAKAGLLGLEVWYGEYDSDLQHRLNDLARQYGLIATGGSDFHGLSKTGHMSGLGAAPVPPESVTKLKKKKIEIEKKAKNEREARAV